MFFFLIFKSFTIDGVIWVFNIIQCSRDYKLFLFMVIQGDQSWVDLIPVTGGEFFIQARISTIVGCYSEQFLSASEAKSALLAKCSGSQLVWIVSQGVSFAFPNTEKFLGVNKLKELSIFTFCILLVFGI